jgi:hypothetical protein
VQGLKEPEKDESEEARPRNIIEFARDCLGITLFPSQKAILKAYYTLPLDDEDRDLLTTWKLEGKTNWEEGTKYDELVLVAGMRSGKTALAAVIGTYEADRVASYEDPARHFGLLPGQSIYVVNVARSEDQAKRTVFGAMEGMIENSSYYQDLINARKFKKQTTQQMAYLGKRVYLISGHSDSGSIVGNTAIAVIFDELARFQDSKTKAYSGKMIYDSLGRAVATLRGRKVSISSPISEDDCIMDLFRLGMEKHLRGMLVFRLATWEMNPDLPRDCAFIENEYAKDPEAAERDYGANPPTTDTPYFQFPERIDKCIVDNMPPCLVESDLTMRILKDTGEIKEYVRLKLADLNFSPEHVYYAFGDAATEADSYALAVGHGVPIIQDVVDEEGNPIQRMIQKPIVDLILEWEPDRKNRRPVDVLNVTAILEELAKHIVFKKIMFDRFNAPHQIQRLVELGIDAESRQFSNEFQLKLYDTLKGLIYTYNIEITQHVNAKPSEKHINQLKHIRLTAGKKITHKELGKDLADVIAGLAWLISSTENEETVHIVMPTILGVNLRT